ncbi:MAG: hypothetical protein ACE5K9_07530 [Candidatus Methylomirabilales bacterium]
MVTLTLPSIDHFLCYEAKTAEGEPKFERRSVTLEDQFGSVQMTVRKPEFFCNPVEKNGEGIPDPALHLTCYKIRDDDGEEFERRDVVVENQFGEQILTVKKPKLLCVPSLKTGGQ